MIDLHQQALLELLKASLFRVEPSFPDGVDWDAVLEEAQAHTVVALAAPAVPGEQSGKWKERALQSTAHYMRALHEQSRLVSLFVAHDIPLVILKGAAAAMYYPVPSRRTMGDVDFLVPPDRFDAARQLMDENGYAFRGDYGDGRDYTYHKGGVVLELHRRYSDADHDIEDVILDGMRRAETGKINGSAFPALPPEVNGLVLLDHVRHHLHGGLGLRQIIDWMMFVHACMTDDFWRDRFAPLAREAHLERLAVTMTYLCRRWIGLPDAITWCDSADEATAQKLLETVLHSGNFGRKDPYVYRPMESAAMGIRREGFFPFLQHTGVANWQAAQRHAFLRPFAWLYQLFRFAFKGVAALFRGADFKKEIAEGADKSDFYEQLGIGKSEDD